MKLIKTNLPSLKSCRSMFMLFLSFVLIIFCSSKVLSADISHFMLLGNYDEALHFELQINSKDTDEKYFFEILWVDKDKPDEEVILKSVYVDDKQPLLISKGLHEIEWKYKEDNVKSLDNIFFLIKVYVFSEDESNKEIKLSDKQQKLLDKINSTRREKKKLRLIKRLKRKEKRLLKNISNEIDDTRAELKYYTNLDNPEYVNQFENINFDSVKLICAELATIPKTLSELNSHEGQSFYITQNDAKTLGLIFGPFSAQGTSSKEDLVYVEYFGRWKEFQCQISDDIKTNVQYGIGVEIAISITKKVDSLNLNTMTLMQLASSAYRNEIKGKIFYRVYGINDNRLGEKLKLLPGIGSSLNDTSLENLIKFKTEMQSLMYDPTVSVDIEMLKKWKVDYLNINRQL